jgi:hypothetical protein
MHLLVNAMHPRGDIYERPFDIHCPSGLWGKRVWATTTDAIVEEELPL